MQTDDVSETVDERKRVIANSLPLLPAPSKFETVGVLKAAISARAELAAFSQALKQSTISGAAIAAYSKLETAAALQLQGEAVELNDAIQGQYDHNEFCLAHHVAVRHDAYKHLQLRPVSSTLALDLANLLQDTPVSIRRGEEQAVESSNISDACYLKLAPPTGAERLQTLLDNWNGFVQQDSGDLDPLILCAVAHGQWLALRPFTGGNLVVGQLLTSLLMCEEDLLPVPALPLSLYFSKRAERFWRALYDAVAHGHFEEWLVFFMTAVKESAIDATRQIMQWEHLNRELQAVMNDVLPKAPSPELVSVCNLPSFSQADLSDAGLTRRQTATAWMQRLESTGLISEIRVGKQKRYFNNAVVSLLLS